MAVSIYSGKTGPKPRRNAEQLPGDCLETVPNPPAWMDDRATEFYHVACTDLLRRKILYEVDLPTLCAFACAQSQLNAANEDISNRGLLVNGKKNPSAMERGKLTQEISALSKLLGFGPYGRSATPGKPDEAEKADDEFDL